MKLKKMPVKPVRKKFDHGFDIPEGPLSEVIKEINRRVPDYALDEPRIEMEYDWDNTECNVTYQTLEDDSSFNERMHQYELKLAEYNEWYNANKEEIEAELKARKDKEQYKLDQKKKRLKAEMEALQRKMDKLNNANNLANTK